MKGWLLGIGLSLAMSLAARTAPTDGELAKMLADVGMENVAVLQDGGIIFVAYDDPVYREKARSLFDVIRLLLELPELEERVHVVVMDEQVPQLEVQIPRHVVRYYRLGEYSLVDVMRVLNVSHDTEAAMVALRGVERVNRSFGKVDLVFYPRIVLRNAWLDKLYGVILDVMPTIEVGLWNGASLTGQVIVPLWNNMTGEMDYIRPGMLLFRQRNLFFANWHTVFSIGNFNRNRVGMDGQVMFRPDHGRWAAGARAGLTGSSTFYNGHWKLTPWRRISGEVFAQYHVPTFDMDMEVSGHRYVYGDYGVRVDASRHFGEVTVGVYAMRTGGEYNGGFHFAIPLYPEKRNKRKKVHLRLPRYFDWEYGAQSGNEYAARRLGWIYETRPDENRSEAYVNPAYIRSRLIEMSERFEKVEK